MAANEDVVVCESWEDVDEINLNDKVNLNTAEATASETVEVTTLRNTVCNVVVDENAIESQFINQEPSIRILKRPSTAPNGFNSNGEGRNRPVMTLEQRQKVYEEARLRILGEARSPEDIIDETLDRLQLQDKLQPAMLNDKIKVKERPSLLSISSGVLSSRSSPPGVLILRNPKAPDGTKGFNVRR